MATGLDFPGGAGVTAAIRAEFASPFAFTPATYIWRAYPRNQADTNYYYVTFFWGPGGDGHIDTSQRYFGCHPYPDWASHPSTFWEIAAPSGADIQSPSHAVMLAWYQQVAIAYTSGGRDYFTFYWNWPSETDVITYDVATPADPSGPVLAIGGAPWDLDAGAGNECYNGILRGFQFYDAQLSLANIAAEIASPGSYRTPWYLNLNPTPSDISDKSGSGHNPAWVNTERPTLYSVAEADLTGTATGSIGQAYLKAADRTVIFTLTGDTFIAA